MSNGRSDPHAGAAPGVISDLQWHPARNEVAFTLAGARAFNDVYSDRRCSRIALERWTFSEMGGAQPGNAARRRDRQVEKLRRPRDLGRALSSARQLHRARGR